MNTATSAVDFPSQEQCAEHFAPLWRECDVHPAWPATTDEAVQLLQASGYAVTIETLEGWARSKQIPNVRIQGGRFVWSPQQTWLAGSLCESQRRWIPFHERHVHKLTAVELAEHQANQLGQSIFTDIDSVDFRSLIGVVMGPQGSDPNLRSTLCIAILSKLKKAGIE